MDGRTDRGIGIGKFGIGKEVSVSVSEFLVSEKKYQFRFRKNLVSEKSLGFGYRKFGLGKKSKLDQVNSANLLLMLSSLDNIWRRKVFLSRR